MLRAGQASVAEGTFYSGSFNSSVISERSSISLLCQLNGTMDYAASNVVLSHGIQCAPNAFTGFLNRMDKVYIELDLAKVQKLLHKLLAFYADSTKSVYKSSRNLFQFISF